MKLKTGTNKNLGNQNCRVAVYRRVGDHPGADDFLSMEEKMNRYMIAERGWTFAGFYGEVGKPNAVRQKLLQACKEGQIDMIMVNSLSRLDRDSAKSIGIIEELAALTKPVEVYIEKMNLFSLDESDKQILEVLKQFMEEEK